MKKLTLLLCILICQGCLTPSKALSGSAPSQRFFFEMTHSNYAWVQQHHGLFIDAQGEVYTYNHSHALWQPADSTALTEEELLHTDLPAELKPYHDKLFGLTISPERLHRIRNERRPDSRYASLAQCRLELNQADDLFQVAHIPVINTTTMSVEEIATTIMTRAGLGPNSRRA